MSFYRTLRRKTVSLLNGKLMPRLGVKLVRSWPKNFAWEKLGQQGNVSTLKIRGGPRGGEARVRLREGTSDWMTFDQIFIDEDYDLRAIPRYSELHDLYQRISAQGTPLIVDLGGNIGFSALYFSLIWPEAQVVAIEPDLENYRLLQENIEGRARISARHAGIASEATRLGIVDPSGGTNAFTTRIVADERDGTVEGVTMSHLLDEFSRSRGFIPFIVKIDIEGAEAELFSRNVDWLDRFPLAIVELHDWLFPGKRTAGNFLKVVAEADRDFIYSDENVFSIRNGIPELAQGSG